MEHGRSGLDIADIAGGKHRAKGVRYASGVPEKQAQAAGRLQLPITDTAPLP
jgi:hypothetical protein